MYVAVKGGERAIENAHGLLAHERRGDPAVPEMTLEQISGQLALAVDRVMSEGSLYDRELAALAIKQARGDLIEAIFLVRAFRTTGAALRRSEPIDTAAMASTGASRRPSRICRAGRCWGRPSTIRIGCSITTGAGAAVPEPARAPAAQAAMPRVTDLLAADDLIEPSARPTGQAGRRSHARAVGVSGRPRSAAAEPRARR